MPRSRGAVGVRAGLADDRAAPAVEVVEGVGDLAATVVSRPRVRRAIGEGCAARFSAVCASAERRKAREGAVYVSMFLDSPPFQ